MNFIAMFLLRSQSSVRLSIGENHLSGLVPSIFHDFPLLQDLSLGTNLLSGAPATFLGQLPALLFLYLDNNLFTGTIPTVITDNNHLQDLVIYGNHLTGTIAASVGEMVNITDLDLSLNYLTGSIPKLTKLIHIEGCLLRFNKLSGNVNGLFDPFTQTQLNTLQINNNQLTGIIPPEFFALRRLNTLVATNNCFQGTLPDNICDAASLLSLILDGMSSAAACRRELFPGMLQSYVTTLSVKGTVPACLFQLPNLTTLHLSGNGFYGTLPDIDFFGAALVDVALSYNALTGTIPKALQERKWYSLDLSFNLLRGTLSEDIHTKPIYNLPHFNYTFKFLKPSFSLENNFLSGKIPTQLHDLPSISILGTNLFDCDLLGSQLPQSDNDRSTYQCGSTAFDTPYYVFIGLCVVVFVVTAAVTGQQRQRLCTSVVQNVEVIMHHIAQCSDKLGRLDNLCKVAAWCTAYAVLLLLPVYVVFQPYYGVMRYQYAWSVSAAFLSSSTAADALMFLWLFLLGFFLYFVERYGVSKSRTIERSAAIRLEELTRIGYTSYQENKVFAMYTTVNVVVVLSANVLYVYVTIYESSSVLFLVRILMSIFKLFWNNICAPRLLFYICEWILPDSGSQADKLVTLQLTIALVNTIVIPCLVVAGISSDCFYNLFVAAPAVASNYASQVCQVGNVEDQCLEYLQYPGTTTFDPPFTYKYQCSWSLVIYYAPPFVYMCIVSIFVVPAALLVAVRLRAYATKGTYLYSVIDSCIPTIMQSFSGDDASQHVTKRTSFCRGPRAVMMLLTLTGLVLTFGVVFPPLAAAFMATMIAATLFDKYKVGKFRAAALELGLTQLLQVLDQDCLDLDIVPVHESAIWMLVTLSCWFYSLFLFDILGSVVGFQRAFWVLIVFPLLPLCFYVARSALYYLFNKFGTAAEQNVFDNGTIELELGEKKTSTIIQLETENVLHSTQ